MEDDFALLFENDWPLLDVRSPVEFAKGAFPGSCNIPLLSDSQRSEIGKTYRSHGHDAAMALGHRLVRGPAKAQLVSQWREFILANPRTRLYCFRGGQRSRIAQQWLHEAGVDVPLVAGGYKALRGYLLGVLESASKLELLVIAGKTGTGKTGLVASSPRGIDIEHAARHRGSAFGALPTPQPAQISFENELAIALLKLARKSPQPQTLLVEDESRSVGSLAIPQALFERMKQAPLAVLEAPFELRVETILRDYVLDNLAVRERNFPGQGKALLAKSLLASVARIRRRLGATEHRIASELLQSALAASDESEAAALHRRWIGHLLTRYYDPMYEYQLARKESRVRFRGSLEQVAEWCRSYTSCSAMA